MTTPLRLPFPRLDAVAVVSLAGAALDLGRGPLQRGPDLLGLQLGDRPLVAFGGLLAALPEPAGPMIRSSLERESARCSAWHCQT